MSLATAGLARRNSADSTASRILVFIRCLLLPPWWRSRPYPPPEVRRGERWSERRSGAILVEKVGRWGCALPDAEQRARGLVKSPHAPGHRRRHGLPLPHARIDVEDAEPVEGALPHVYVVGDEENAGAGVEGEIDIMVTEIGRAHV